MIHDNQAGIAESFNGGVVAETKQNLSTRFYRWEGDACRLHRDADGNLTADLYRAGKGLLPIDPFELEWKGAQITPEVYMILVEREAGTSGAPGMIGIWEKFIRPSPKMPIA